MLHYHRCDDCLTAFTTVERQVDFCDCSGEVTYMGEVSGSNYLRTENRTPCDGRCTHASGPVCDCMCNGVNHGTGKLVQVKVIAGKVHVTNLSPEDIERAIQYRGLRDFADKMVGDTVDLRSRMTMRYELNRIIAKKQYVPRMQAIVNFISKYHR